MSFRFSFLHDLKKLYENEIKDIPEDQALDSIIYGTCCHRIKNGSPSKGMLSISDKISDNLCFSDQVKNKTKSFQLKNVININVNKMDENLKDYSKRYEEEQFIQININQKTYDFSFHDKNKLLLFIKGLISMFNSNNKLGDKKKEVGNYMEERINNLFDKNNDNFDDILDENEFKNLAEEIGIEHKELLLYIDNNRDGFITKAEVLNYFKSLISGTEFLEIFKKYSSIKKDNNNNENNEYTMNPEELKKFFNEVQKEPISELEAFQLIINFKSYISNELKRKMGKKFKNIFFYNKNQVDKEKINKAMNKLNKEINSDKENKLTNKNIFDKNKSIFNKNKNIEIKLELNLKEFSNMLNSYLLTVYDKKKQKEDLNTNHSLVDYYINSSHNTYLKSHQLKGLSDPKMYTFAVLNGYRLVELDCYNGQDDDIIITHGYTLVTKLKVDDILKELKENGFKNSPYPIILSVENHLDKKHQEILAKKFQEYLVDIYVFPYDSPPETIPTLEELKYKFIIKCGGKRLYEGMNIPLKEIIKDDENIILRGKPNMNSHIKKYILEDNYEDVSDSDEDDESESIDEFTGRHEIIVNRERYLEKMDEIKENIKKEKNNIVTNILKNKDLMQNLDIDIDFSKEFKNIESKKDKEEKKENDENEIVIEINDSDNNLLNYDKNEDKEVDNADSIIITENENPTTPFLKKINIDIKDDADVDEPEKEENEYIKNLENLRGFLGQKFKYEQIESFNYKHWEFVTLKSTLYLKLYTYLEKRKKLLELSFHCMMKAYPQNFDSSNYDIIRCWCCGCQAAAINIQATDDDFTLFNQVFFTQNNNCGYVLKPRKFLLNTFQFEEYKMPKYYLKIEIINLFNFSKLIEIENIQQKKNAKLYMKIYSLGPYTENDLVNSKKYKNEYSFELIGGLLTPSILNNHKIKIPVYEESLGGIIIKFIYDKEVIGRGCIPYCLMKMGYRKIPIYCNDCIIRESIFVIGFFEKVF